MDRNEISKIVFRPNFFEIGLFVLILNIPVVYRARLILKRLSFLYIQQIGWQSMTTIDLLCILGFCAPFSISSYELSSLQGLSVGVQNHNVEIYTVLRKLRGTIVNIILPPRVLFYCREIYFTAASFILLPRVLFYCRGIYFTAASFILAPRVLYYCREFYYTAARFILPPRVLFSPPRVLFSPLAVK